MDHSQSLSSRLFREYKWHFFVENRLSLLPLFLPVTDYKSYSYAYKDFLIFFSGILKDLLDPPAYFGDRDIFNSPRRRAEAAALRQSQQE